MISNISINELSAGEKLYMLTRIVPEPFNTQAVFSDETPNYRAPAEPGRFDLITVKIRTAKNNADEVYVVVSGKRYSMMKEKTEGLFDYYKTHLPPKEDRIDYYFEISKNRNIYYYSKSGLSYHYNDVNCFFVIRDYSTPDWAAGAVTYQIFIDRFFNGDKSNDVKTGEYNYLGKLSKRVEDWQRPIEPDDIRDFYGGDLQGVIDKLDYLADIGVQAIYFNPLFVSPSTHKYDIQDYDYIDPHVGVIIEDGGELIEEGAENTKATMYIKRTASKANLEASNKLFIRLVELAHSKGIKVILDGVFNHCGAFNKWLDREKIYSSTGQYPAGAYSDKDSIYKNYFRWNDENAWPDNNSYDGWWGYSNHPKLNYEGSKELYDYIISVGKKWVSPPYNIDGWRLDVAADLGCSAEFNHKFWNDFRNAVKSANKDAVIISEHYGDASPWLDGKQWDTVMNYDAFMEPLTYFLTGMEKHSESYRDDLYNNGKAFEYTLNRCILGVPFQSIKTAMNELSNHDHSRFLTRTNKRVGRLHVNGSKSAEEGIDKSVFMEAVVFQFTWIGCPTIYYGDEAGLCGWTDPDNRRTYPWGNEDMKLIELHKKAINIRKSCDTFNLGSTIVLFSDYGVFSFGRFDNENRFAIILNNDSVKRDISIPVWRMGSLNNSSYKSLLYTSNCDFSCHETVYNIKEGNIQVSLEPRSSLILKET